MRPLNLMLLSLSFFASSAIAATEYKGIFRGVITNGGVSENYFDGPIFRDWTGKLINGSFHLKRVPTQIEDPSGYDTYVSIFDGWTWAEAWSPGSPDFPFFEVKDDILTASAFDLWSPTNASSRVGIVFDRSTKRGSGGSGSYIPYVNGSLDFVTDYSFDIQYASAYAVVPEAPSWALLISGFGGMGAILRRKRLRNSRSPKST